jgi:phosphoribosyl-ATP diphosphatase
MIIPKMPHRIFILIYIAAERSINMTVYEEIFEVIKKRKAEFDSGTAQENSYTCYLFEKGVDKICKKIGEEATETVIAAKNKNNNELKNEINDLLYHIMVLCVNQGLEWSDVEKVLDERNEKIGNLKKFHQVDKNT